MKMSHKILNQSDDKNLRRSHTLTYYKNIIFEKKIDQIDNTVNGKCYLFN